MTDLILKLFCALKADRRGVTAMEYAIIGALVIAVCVGAFTSLGTSISTKISALATTVSG